MTRSLEISDLAHLSRDMLKTGQPMALFHAVELIAAETIGCRLFTIMAYDAQECEVERVFTNMPDVYPSGGRKKKRGTQWSKQVLQELRPYRGETVRDIRASFDDHAVMTNMGLGSILNIPIGFDGLCIGTMNLTHVERWYRPEHEDIGILLGSFLAPALTKLAQRRSPKTLA
jgi:transcriptional regulator with GAF, ATPase, and Fis domain